MRPRLHPRRRSLGLTPRTCDSGRQIVDILKKNPNKDPDGYEEDDIAHMRRVVAVSVMIPSSDRRATTKA